MTKRYLVGGPSNSGKSTFVLSLVECLRARGFTAEAIELDVWSNSYVAFEGKVDFDKRPKRFDLKWAWKPALAKRLHAFNTSQADYVFGDMPGVLGAAGTHMCDKARPTGAIVISRSIDELRAWQRFFRDDFDIPIVQTFLSVQKVEPLVLPDMKRCIDADNAHVQSFAKALSGDACEPPKPKRVVPKRERR